MKRTDEVDDKILGCDCENNTTEPLLENGKKCEICKQEYRLYIKCRKTF